MSSLKTLSLKNKTLFITGGSRGIGRAIALKAAQDGANIALAAKTAEPHPKLPGTLYTVAKEIEAAGGQALPLQTDIRDENQILQAIEKTAQTFGGIDILVNNASAIAVGSTAELDMKRFDLMFGVNVRGTFATSKIALPYLKKAENPHILMLSPPLNMAPKWFAAHGAYTISKYGMSMCVLGMAEEFKPMGISVNALWPQTAIATAALNLLGGEEIIKASRKPEIVAEAAYWILTQPRHMHTGKFFIDEAILRAQGLTDFEPYAVHPGTPLRLDFFLDED